MNANERFEYMAEQFYRKTGMLAPGKDDPLFQVHSESYHKKRILEWNKFTEEFYANLFQTNVDMYEMLEQSKAMLENFHRNTGSLGAKAKAEEIELLLKRARGE